MSRKIRFILLILGIISFTSIDLIFAMGKAPKNMEENEEISVQKIEKSKGREDKNIEVQKSNTKLENSKVQVHPTPNHKRSKIENYTGEFELDSNGNPIKYIPSDQDIQEWIGWYENGENDFIKEEGISRLGRSGNPKSIETLLKALKDESPNIRQYAAGYLWKYQDRRIKLSLIEALKKETSLSAQENIINALRKIGSSEEDEKIINECSESLKQQMRQIAKSGKKNDKKTRAIFELVNLLGEEPQQYEDFLVSVLNSDSSNQEKKVIALRLLEKIDTDKSISAIKKALNDKDDYIKGQADSVLKRLKNKK